jgi:hypothetical protein
MASQVWVNLPAYFDNQAEFSQLAKVLVDVLLIAARDCRNMALAEPAFVRECRHQPA